MIPIHSTQLFIHCTLQDFKIDQELYVYKNLSLRVFINRCFQRFSADLAERETAKFIDVQFIEQAV